MTRQPTVQIRSRLRILTKHYRWWLALAFLIVFVASAAYQVAPAPAVASPAAVAAQAQDPAMQAVLAYLRAHTGTQPAPTPTVAVDQAQQSVMQYVRAHQPIEQPAPLWEQLKQTIVGYL